MVSASSEKLVGVHALGQVSAAVKYPCAWLYRKDVLARAGQTWTSYWLPQASSPIRVVESRGEPQKILGTFGVFQ